MIASNVAKTRNETGMHGRVSHKLTIFPYECYNALKETNNYEHKSPVNGRFEDSNACKR